MQTISDSSKNDMWKQAHRKTILNESFVEVSLDIGDPESVADAARVDEQGNPLAVTDNGAIYISASSALTNGVDDTHSPYCTLEQNLWCLDGNRKVIPEGGVEEKGYIGDVLCDATCIFSTKLPTITIAFSKKFTTPIPGITIVWSKTYNEFADTFEVIAYNGDTVVASKEVTKNRSTNTIILVEIPEYDRIVVVVKKWCLPLHRARIEEIYVGVRKIYGKADLFDYTHSQVVDPISTTLPKMAINFSVSNIDDEFNPHNPEGLTPYLMERQEVKTKYGLKLDDGTVQWIPGGTFYLSDWFAKQNGMTADFTARDSLEFLSDIYSDKAIGFDRSLGDLARTILNRAELPTPSAGAPKWIIHESLDKITTTAPIPQDTLANLLQLIANAGQCTIYPDRNGTLRIEPLVFEHADYTINSFNSYAKSEITLSKPLKQVIVKVYAYTKADGKVTATTDEEVSYSVGSVGETIIIDNPLVTDTSRASALAEWIANYLKHRMTLDSSWRPDVRLDALDIVNNENAYDSKHVRMTEITYKYNGAFRATGKGKVIENG